MKTKSSAPCRNPFSVINIPAIARFYLWAYDARGLDLVSRLRRLLGPKLYHVFRRFHLLPAKGSFRYELGGREIVIDFDGRNTQFLSIYDKPYRYGYEMETSLAIDLLTGEEDILYDIGSNWGHFSLFLASKPGFQGRVFAFEPFPPSFADLQSTIRQAGLSEKIAAYPVALSNYDGDSSMVLPDGIRSGLASLSEGGSGPGVRTKVVKLDSLDLPPPTFMKLDVEGNESRVIAGGRKTIAKHAPFVVFEHHREGVDSSMSIFDELRRLEYVFFIPALQFEEKKRIVRVTYGEDYASLIGRYGSYKFCLVPMKVEDRSLFPVQLNILAVHKRKVKRVKELIPESR